METLSLYELNALVRQALERQVSATYWVQAELSDVRVNASGHCYVEFVQKSPRGNALVAKARGNIWANVFQMLKPYFEEATGQAFAPGIKVLVCVSVSFHELYGYSLTVHDIDPAYTLGDLAQRRREILRQLEEEGVLTLNKELPMPPLPQRVAVISSPTAAGYGDFRHQLEHNPRGYYFQVELFPAVMQGDAVEETVLDALDRINARLAEFDVVVIIRGGGATSDLSGFDTYMLAAACAQFPLPIITGIGHERDDTVLDSVAHTRVKTPTAAAEHLIARMDEAADRLYTLAARLQQAVRGPHPCRCLPQPVPVPPRPGHRAQGYPPSRLHVAGSPTSPPGTLVPAHRRRLAGETVGTGIQPDAEGWPGSARCLRLAAGRCAGDAAAPRHGPFRRHRARYAY